MELLNNPARIPEAERRSRFVGLHLEKSPVPKLWEGWGRDSYQGAISGGSRFGRWIRRLVAWTAVALLGFALRGEEAAKEYAVKAVFLLNFAHFVDWPDDTFARDAPFVIGVIGEDPFGPILDSTVKGERVESRTVVVRRFKKVSEIGPCQILFVPKALKSQQNEILGKLAGRNILTVGDADQFNEGGGIIEFILEDRRLRLRVNLAAARQAELVISSQLLRRSKIYDPSEVGGKEFP